MDYPKHMPVFATLCPLKFCHLNTGKQRRVQVYVDLEIQVAKEGGAKLGVVKLTIHDACVMALCY